MKRLIPGLLMLALAACATAPAPAPADLDLGFRYIDSDGHPVLRQDLPTEVWLELPLISGAVFGAITTGPQYQNLVKINRRFTIDGDFFTRRIADYATPLLSNPYNDNVVVTPANTRLVRVATFVYTPRTGEFLGPTGLSAPDTRHLVLVYFDRPAQLSGYNVEDDSRIDYAVSIERPGLVWLTVREIAENHYRLENYSPTGDEYIAVEVAPAHTI